MSLPAGGAGGHNGAMTKRKTRVDEVIILGPRRPITAIGENAPAGIVARALAEGKTLTPDQEAMIRDEVARFTVSEGSDFTPPSFVRRGLAVGGYMSVRRPVEYTDYDYTEIEPATVEPAPEDDPAVQKAREVAAADAEATDEDAQPEPEDKPQRSTRKRRSRS